MKAEYFYNEVMSDRHNNEGYDGWYSSGIVTIHKIGSGDKDIHYILYRSGLILDSKGKRVYAISDLDGDYEPYSEVQIVKCGYLLFNGLDFTGIKQVISNLYTKFESEERNEEMPSGERHLICGGSVWDYGLTENFSYYAPNGIEVSIYSIPRLCHGNSERKKYGKKCFPFNKDYAKENAIYATFTVSISNDDLDGKANEAVKDLLNNLAGSSWVDINLPRYIYC